MKCDELKEVMNVMQVSGEHIPSGYYKKFEVDAAIAELKDENATLQGANDEKAERIVELQKQVDELVIVKKSAELIFMNLLDCGLIKEWYFNGKFNAVLKDDTPLLKIEALKQKLEDVQASAYADSVDAGMRERSLKRALWLKRTDDAKHLVTAYENYDYLDCSRITIRQESARTWMTCKLRTPAEWVKIWKDVERRCLKKAEEYK